MTTTAPNEIVDRPTGDWNRSDALRSMLIRKAGVVTPETRAMVRQLATMSGYGRALLRAKAGDSRDLEMLSRALLDAGHEAELSRAIGRGAPTDELARAVAHDTTTDVPGALPEALVGDVIRFVDTSRPLITASRRLPLPNSKGSSFLRPRTTQGTLASKQSAEGAVADSQRWKVDGDVVEKGWVADTLTVSEQALDWSGDNYVDALVRDMAKTHAAKTSAIFCAAVEAAATSSDSIPTSAGVDVVLGTLSGAIPVIVAAAGVRPDILIVSTARFAQLAGLMDLANRPVPPALIADALDVTLVIDPALSDGALMLAVSQYLEWYENTPAPVRLAAPSTVELNVTFSGAIATYVPEQAVFTFPTS